MNVIFCGSEVKGNFVEEICRRKKDKVYFTGARNHISDYEDDLFGGQYDVIVIDISELIDDSSIIVDYMKRLKKAKNSKLVIFAAGYSYRSAVINDLINAGFVNFILAAGLATQNDEYEKCINGENELNSIDEKIQEEIQEEIQEREKAERYKSIGIAGTMARIGTTTQCLQIVKYLMFKGYRAAYVEINANGYIEKSQRLYSDILEHPGQNYITYNDIDMYHGNNLNDAIRNGYDYIVCDYGSLDDPSFNKVSFMEKEIKIFVAGSKPSEFDKIQPVLQSAVYSDAAFIFNFIPESDKKDLLEMMCEKAENTIFSGITLDPFDYVAANDYEKILGVEERIVEEEEKVGFFEKLKMKRGK